MLGAVVERRIVDAPYLNVWDEPGRSGKILGRVYRNEILTVLEKRILEGWSAAWGRTERGWVYLNRTKAKLG